MQDEIQQTIAKDLGIAELGAEEQQMIITQFGVVALKAATVAIALKMPEDKRAEFTTLASSGDPAALQAFLNTTVPNHEALAKAAVEGELKKLKEFQAAGKV